MSIRRTFATAGRVLHQLRPTSANKSALVPK